MAYLANDRRSRLPSAAAVLLVHAGIGYALISGFAATVVERISGPLTVIDLAPEKAPPPPAPTPVKQENMTRTKVIVAPDGKKVSTVELPVTEGPFDQPIDVTTVKADPPPPPPPPGTAVSVRGNRANWITADDYPPAAQRQGEHGTVGITATIGIDGRVTGCDVVQSSGSPTLDDTTCKLYSRRARFNPARDAGGTPIPSTYSDRVTWKLPD